MIDRDPEPSTLAAVRQKGGVGVEPQAPGPASAKSLRIRLREETRGPHERLDGSFAGLADGDRRDYGLFLRVNAACLAAVEPWLEASPLAAAMPDVVAAARGAAAKADLDAMDMRPIVVPAFPLACPSLAQAIGVAYVTEGSRLGGRMILKRLRNGDDAATDGPITTFFLDTAGGPERFRDFLNKAETLAATGADQDAAVAAARATFAYFLDAVRLARAADHDGGVN